jgi:hypothetical protein
LGDKSLYEICEKFKFKSKQCAAKKNDGVCPNCYAMTNDTGFFHEVGKPFFLRFHHPANDKTAKFKEDYYRRLILLLAGRR